MALLHFDTPGPSRLAGNDATRSRDQMQLRVTEQERLLRKENSTQTIPLETTSWLASASMEFPRSRCPGCGAELAAGALPYRGYYNTSAECWSEYTHVLAVEYQDTALFAQVHQLTVDAYAVQHAGGPHPDKSVAVHLVGLYLVLERDFKPFDVPPRLQALSAAVANWQHFEVPKRRAVLTAHDLAKAGSTQEHATRVREWADQIWTMWGAHHPAIAALAENCFAISERQASNSR